MTSTRRRRSGAAAALTFSLVALAGCTGERESGALPPSPRTPSETATASAPAPGEDGSPRPAGEPEVIVSGLTTPWSVAFVGETALISQRDTGEILELSDEGTRVIGEVPDLAARGEGGLLGLAHAQDFLYAYVTTPGGNRVVRFALEGMPGSFALGAVETIVDGIPSANIHNGGRLAFDRTACSTSPRAMRPIRKPPRTPRCSAARSSGSPPTAASRRTTPCRVRPSGASATATPRASGGMPRARCSRRSSVKTPGTSSTSSSRARITAGRKSRVSATTIASPIPYSNGRPPMPVPAASPSSETPSSSPISAVSVFGSCPLPPRHLE